MGIPNTNTSKISIHALLAESDWQGGTTGNDSWDFYPRSPCGERPGDYLYYIRLLDISIHALLAESDTVAGSCRNGDIGFLSTLSLRRATACWYIKEMVANISIHALLAESDSAAAGKRAGRYYFYPRSPCGERHTGVSTTFPAYYFYPRSPCGERHDQRLTVTCASHFYPRSPCGERPVPQQENGQAATISIHALLAESDTDIDLTEFNKAVISIHALLAESDGGTLSDVGNGILNFYPRSPCGERQSWHFWQ